MLKMSQHFTREARLMLLLPVLLITIGILVATAAPWLKRQVDVDRCLDAGGKYEYQANTCIGVKEQKTK